MKVSSAHHDHIYIMFGTILEEGSIAFKLLDQGPLLNGVWPVESHRLGSPGADDPLGSILDALESNVLGRVAGANQQQSLAGKLIGISEVVGVENSARELLLVHGGGRGGDGVGKGGGNAECVRGV